MKRFGVAAVVLVLAASVAALAQMGGGPNSGYTPPPSQQQNQQIPQSMTLPRTKAAPTKSEIVSDADSLVKSINLACDVSDAVLINDGTASINGKSVHIRTFEAACGNGLGYFLVDQSPEPVIGFTCFAADATYKADKAAGREPQPACSLPANADVKAAAAAVLSRLGQQCDVTNLRVIGRDTKVNAEVTEVACTGGKGFVIRSPLPGASQAVSVLTCPESYRSGLACKMSDNGEPIITLDTFKQELAKRKVACTPESVRLIGKQTTSKRHVVEFKCPEQPKGLVAFIPLEAGAGSFEVMDCATAGAKARVICALTAVH